MIFSKKRSVEVLEETSIINKETEGLSQGQIVRRRFLRHKGAMISIVFLTAIIIFVYSSLKMKIFGI